MCFVLYAGTTSALPRAKWSKDAPGLSVKPLTEREAAIRQYFTNPEVQYIGSTSGCGCDFPNVMLQNGEWPTIDPDDAQNDELDIARDISERRNRESLVSLLRSTGDEMIELYGIWDGGNEAFARSPQARENIALNKILDPQFRFKEQGFYTVHAEA